MTDCNAPNRRGFLVGGFGMMFSLGPVFAQVSIPPGARRPGDGIPVNRPDAQGRSSTWSRLSPSELVQALQGGGYVLIFRHGRTDWRTSDQLPQRSFDDRRTQRNLSEEGREQGRQTGEVFRALSITFAEVYSSPYFRTRDFAELVTGRQPVVTMKLLGYNEAGINGHRELLSKMPLPGTNTFLSGHQFAVTEMGFVRMNELEEGSCLVFKAHGDEKRLELVAHLNHADILALLSVVARR
jgi:phosphohistidine phosphatase SixA